MKIVESVSSLFGATDDDSQETSSVVLLLPVSSESPISEISDNPRRF